MNPPRLLYGTNVYLKWDSQPPVGDGEGPDQGLGDGRSAI